MLKLNRIKVDEDGILKFLSPRERESVLHKISFHHCFSFVGINVDGLSLVLGKPKLDDVLRLKTKAIIIIIGISG